MRVIIQKNCGVTDGNGEPMHAVYIENAAVDIATAMDYGTNEDIRAALCRYIDAGGYNPALKDWINSREWVKD